MLNTPLGNTIYGTASEPFLEEYHKPGKSTYSGSLKYLDKCKIVKATGNSGNASNVIWLERHGELMFFIVRDKGFYQQFLEDHETDPKDKEYDVYFSNNKWLLK